MQLESKQLKHMLHHWIEHTREHAKRFREKAGEFDEEARKKILEAAALSEETATHLEKALALIE